MAEMVKYNADYISMTYALVKQKGNTDDIKAAEDLYVIDVILSGADTCINQYELDERLRKEYKTIDMMETIANKFICNDLRPVNRIISEKEKIMNRLQSDKIGIIADVLIKHNIVNCVEELYVKSVR
ncbi:MAG: hypothetical protein ACI4E1_09525 [Lachnospira sp.]